MTLTAQKEPAYEFTAREQVLTKILSWRRAHDTEHEKKFCDWIYDQLPEKGRMRDAFGNVHMSIGKNPTVMFSSHVDTVHAATGPETQMVYYDPAKKELFVGKESDCLGADDGVGVWIMLNMIEKGIIGHYVFHRGEECGGLGARWILENRKPWLGKFKQAIAFDRRGFTDVITHQNTRCCSDEYGESLAIALNTLNQTLAFKTCRDGVFTDTKVYAGVIPECVNLSVGYNRQHGPHEMLNLEFANKLLDAVMQVRWSTLKVKRNPATDNEPAYKRLGTWADLKKGQQQTLPLKPVAPKSDMLLEELEVMAGRFPRALAMVAYKLGVKWADLKDAIYDELVEDDVSIHDKYDDWTL